MLVIRRVVALMAAALAMSMVLVSCGGEKPVIPTVDVQGADFSFAMPDTIAGGLTRIRFTNTGQESHHMQILKLNPGLSQEQFSATIDQIILALPEEGESAFGRLFAVSTAAGGPAPIGPGGTVNIVADLEQGGYRYPREERPSKSPTRVESLTR